MVVTVGAVGAMELVAMDTWYGQKRRLRREGKKDEDEDDEGKGKDEDEKKPQKGKE